MSRPGKSTRKVEFLSLPEDNTKKEVKDYNSLL